jgi:protein MpaA
MFLFFTRILLLSIFSLSAIAEDAKTGETKGEIKSDNVVCAEYFAKIPRLPKNFSAQSVCESMKVDSKCRSAQGRPIPHYEKISSKENPYKILVFALIHGDEPLAASLAIRWAERMKDFEPRSSWRVIPILNPDGMYLNTRMNANGVDLNRNFPTKDWEAQAMEYWKGKQKSDPRRFPGATPASEPETLCAMEQIEQFKPDLIVSIHTPYGVLDFDGPKVIFPAFKALPWRSLGNFPGSLGRYMWVDRGAPVLTTELKVSSLNNDAEEFERLQDLTFNLIKSAQASNQKKNLNKISAIEK